MFWPRVSEVYRPDSPLTVVDELPNEQYEGWGYSLAMLKDGNGNDVPPWGNTAIFRIFEGGMTEPVYVNKPELTARFTVNVLAGSGILIRALASGAVEKLPMNEGDEFIITPGQAYSYVNASEKDSDNDLILHDVAMPAFRADDEIKLMACRVDISDYPTVLRPDGRELNLAKRFYDLVFQACAGRLVH